MKRRPVEKLRESVERIYLADDRIARLEPKLRARLSDEYKKVIRESINEQKEILRQIEQEFDSPTSELKKTLLTVIQDEIQAE